MRDLYLKVGDLVSNKWERNSRYYRLYFIIKRCPSVDAKGVHWDWEVVNLMTGRKTKISEAHFVKENSLWNVLSRTSE